MLMIRFDVSDIPTEITSRSKNLRKRFNDIVTKINMNRVLDYVKKIHYDNRKTVDHKTSKSGPI